MFIGIRSLFLTSFENTSLSHNSLENVVFALDLVRPPILDIFHPCQFLVFSFNSLYLILSPKRDSYEISPPMRFLTFKTLRSKFEFSFVAPIHFPQK